MEREHTISWDKVPKYRIIQMVPNGWRANRAKKYERIQYTRSTIVGKQKITSIFSGRKANGL